MKKDLAILLQESKSIKSYTGNITETFEDGKSLWQVLDEEVLEEARKKSLKLPIKENRELILRVKVAHAGVVTANGNYYPKPLLEREVTKLKKRIEERSVFGNDQHPQRRVVKDEKGEKIEMVNPPNFGTTALIPVDIEITESGEVFSTVVVPKTRSGQDFAAIIRAGGRPGISTRGHGTTKTKKISLEVNEGKMIETEVKEVQDDFNLKTFDPVIDQALSDARIISITESQQENKEVSLEESSKPVEVEVKLMKLSEWIKKYPEAQASLVESIQKGEVTVDDVKGIAPLYEGLRLVVAEEMEGEVEENLNKKFDEYLEGIRNELTEEELEEARAEGVALFCNDLGLDAEDARLLAENQEEAGGLFQAVLDEVRGDKGKKRKKPAPPVEDPEGQGCEPETKMNESVEEAVASNPMLQELQESMQKQQELLESMQTQLNSAEKEKTILRLEANFPYKKEIFAEDIKPLLEGADNSEEANQIYEHQVNMLKRAGATQVARGSSKFIANDSKTNDQKVLDESLQEEPEGMSASQRALRIAESMSAKK